ncbi:MAG: hypothetical protein ACTSRK_13680 [Promethearchaeota archaeon]
MENTAMTVLQANLLCMNVENVELHLVKAAKIKEAQSKNNYLGVLAIIIKLR